MNDMGFVAIPEFAEGKGKEMEIDQSKTAAKKEEEMVLCR